VRGVTHAYRLCTLRFESELDLPFLSPWDGDAHAPPDVVCRLGDVPLRLARPNHVAPLFQISRAGDYLLTVPGTGRFLIRNGNELTVETEPAADPSAVRAFLAGTIQAVIWHQRNLLPLRASAIVVNDRTLVLAGPTAAGKSTLAAALLGQGHKLMADNICVLDFASSIQIRVLPGSRRVALWHDALEHLGIEIAGLPRALLAKKQYLIDRHDHFEPQAGNLATVVVLGRRVGSAVSIDRLRGFEALRALHAVVHSIRPGRKLRGDANIFADLTRLAAAGVTVWRLRLPDDLGRLGEAAALALSACEASNP
jgi:hypothetical protein